jgi:hypothetical protein
MSPDKTFGRAVHLCMTTPLAPWIINTFDRREYVKNERIRAAIKRKDNKLN